MRIRPCQRDDWNAARSAFPSFREKASPGAIVLLCEDGGWILAFAWAEPRMGTQGAWEIRALDVKPDYRGIEVQMLLSLEIEAEKREGVSMGAWTAADLPGSEGDFLRDLVRSRGYLFREYLARRESVPSPADWYEKSLQRIPWTEDLPPEGEGGPVKFRFPSPGLN